MSHHGLAAPLSSAIVHHDHNHLTTINIYKFEHLDYNSSFTMIIFTSINIIHYQHDHLNNHKYLSKNSDFNHYKHL